MKTYQKPLLLLFAGSLYCSLLLATPVAKFFPVSLQCELRKTPLGIDNSNPDLSYTLHATGSTDRNLRQTAYQLIVASSSALLQNNNGDLWHPGKVLSDKMSFIKYEGKQLSSGQQCWWKMRVWDNNGNASAWSAPATWVMGIVKQEEWIAKWITAAGAEQFAPSPYGYRAATAAAAQTTKWVQIDLGAPALITQVRITPQFFEDRAGYGFPKNFKIEVSSDSTFENTAVIADYTTAAYDNPGWKPADFAVSNTSARYVRLTTTRLWGSEEHFQFAIRQVEVFANGINIASGKKVTAFDSNDSGGWSARHITDGPADLSALPDYASMLLRKEFEIRKKLVRAVVHISGLSEYELTINGRKVGDFLLTPGWTDYRKTVLYDTYDVTVLLHSSANAIGIMLGNGMYNIQPHPVRYVKFLNSFGPLKAIARLQLEYADGTTTIIATDDSWQVAPGPVTYSNVFGGEDYDANKAEAGWNKPLFKPGSQWQPALITAGPGGTLKGLSCAAPPVKVIEVLQPVNVTKLKENIWVYDCGQNASMMPRIRVTGEQGAYIRIIPAELLDSNGYADRRSATQDGARPAWWQYTLAGKGVERWKPKFFYQGARYLQVELFAAKGSSRLPQVKTLEDQIVHSSSTPVGTFECSNSLFNRIYQLVRWAQRSNMMSLMTDCPHREKMGWLEENHLNGPALRYNFDMALLFRKTMNDMADAQLDNGLIPNIAPEYFIAGPPDLTNGFRNSPEWGSSFIIVPWQQYLFSGDISLLVRYYDRMKKYVAFLSATAKNNIITVGLGDWYDIGPKEPWGSQLTPVSFTATAIYYYDNWIMARIAQLLGKKTDADAFGKKAEAIRTSFNKEFYQPDLRRYATGSQTANAMPLFLGLADPQNRSGLLAAVVADIRAKNNGLTSGDVGYRFLLKALAEGGRSDVIFDMNNQSERPGYGYQLKMGATSLTEKWNAGVGNFGSQNHFMLGQINEWFFNDLAGISCDADGAGFKKIIIRPAVTGDITWVKSSFATMSGVITAQWKKEGSRLRMDVTIPANTSAVIYVPAKNADCVSESGKRASAARSVKFYKYENGYSIYEAGSGTYRFTSNL